MDGSTRNSRRQAIGEQATSGLAHGWATMSLGERIVLAARAAVAARLEQMAQVASEPKSSEQDAQQDVPQHAQQHAPQHAPHDAASAEQTSEFRGRIAIGGAGPRWTEAEATDSSAPTPRGQQVTEDLSGSPDAPPGLAALAGLARLSGLMGIDLDLGAPDPTLMSAPARPCTAARAALFSHPSRRRPLVCFSVEPREGAD